MTQCVVTWRKGRQDYLDRKRMTGGSMYPMSAVDDRRHTPNAHEKAGMNQRGNVDEYRGLSQRRI